MGIAVGIDLSVCPAHLKFATESRHLLVGRDRVIGLASLTVHNSQTVEEERAIAAVRIRVLAVGHGGRGQHRLQHLDGVIEAAQCIVVQRDVVAQLQVVIGNQGLGFLQRRQRLLVISLLPLDLSLMDQRLRILRIGGKNLRVNLGGGIHVSRGGQGCGEAAFRIGIVRIDIECCLIRRGRLLRLFELVVNACEREVHAAAALIRRHIGDHLGGFVELTLLGILARHTQHYFFIVAVDLLCRLKLLLGLGRVMVQTIELAQKQPVLQVIRLQFDDGFVLFDRGLQNVIGLGSLAVAQRAQVDPAQKHVRVEIVGVLVDLILRRGDRFADAAQTEVEIGDAVLQDRRSGIGVHRQLVLLDRLSG